MITTKARDLAKEFKNPELSQEEENAIYGRLMRGKNKPKICIHCNKEIDGSYAHIVNPAYGADWYLHWTECVSEFLAALPVEDHVEQDNLQAKEPK